MMSVSKPSGPVWCIPFVVFFTIAGVELTAETPHRLRAFAGGPAAEPLTQTLPPVDRRAMTMRPRPLTDVTILSFDDGTCESGLGLNASFTSFVDFDVPTQCFPMSLDIVGLTARLNTGESIATFAFGQAGAAPPRLFEVSTVALGTAIPPSGPCPGTELISRPIMPGAAVITDTTNFFAGVRGVGFIGRDTNSPGAGRMWLNCPICGMSQYSPTDLREIGLGGNWMIRVTVEDQNCIPVELMDFIVSDG